MNAKFHVSGDSILDMAPDFSEIPLPDEKDAPPENRNDFTPSEIAELERQEPNVTVINPDAPPPPFNQQLRPTLPSFITGKRQTFSPVKQYADAPHWWDGKKINEVELAAEFVVENPLCCVNGQLYSIYGKLDSDDRIRTALYSTIRPFVSTSLPSRVGTLVETVKRECSVDELDYEGHFIHLANGTYDVMSGDFSSEMRICRYRLPVNYDVFAKPPERFLDFISQLFFPEDIATVQEYVGYCLLPYTIGQKMLLIIGRGGEGKSTFGGVLSALFGSACINSSIHMLEASRFNMAELEDKLLMIDDDMKLDTLPSTSKLKTLVTAMDPVQVERKGVQPYLAKLYCRVIGFGNYSLESFNDSSVGFFRRQIILRTRLPEKGRRTDPNLLAELKTELPAILNWALEGLSRLMANNFRFHISKRAKNNLTEVMLEANNIPDFLATDYMKGDMITSQELYSSYVGWCEKNGDEPISRKRAIKFIKENCERYGIQYSKHINVDGNVVRGFRRIIQDDDTI